MDIVYNLELLFIVNLKLFEKHDPFMRIFYFSGNADKRSKKDDDEDDSKDEDGDNSDSVDNDAEVKWKKKASKLLGIDRWWGRGDK